MAILNMQDVQTMSLAHVAMCSQHVAVIHLIGHLVCIENQECSQVCQAGKDAYPTQKRTDSPIVHPVVFCCIHFEFCCQAGHPGHDISWVQPIACIPHLLHQLLSAVHELGSLG